MSFMSMNVMSADQKITNMAARNCSHNWWNEWLPYISPCTENGVQLLEVLRY